MPLTLYQFWVLYRDEILLLISQPNVHLLNPKEAKQKFCFNSGSISKGPKPNSAKLAAWHGIKRNAASSIP